MPDPSGSFAVIQRNAACPFAGRARIEADVPYTGQDAEEAGRAAARHLARFAARIEQDELDGLLIELTDARHGATIEAAAATTRAVIAGLLEAVGESADRALERAADEHWWLELFDTRWFVLLFAVCYPHDSPRSTFGSPSTYLLFQPVASFDRHAVPKGGVISVEVRERIRRDYANTGRPYDGALAQQDVEALKFVWPLCTRDNPVRWWMRSSRSEVEHGD